MRCKAKLVNLKYFSWFGLHNGASFLFRLPSICEKLYKSEQSTQSGWISVRCDYGKVISFVSINCKIDVNDTYVTLAGKIPLVAN